MTYARFTEAAGKRMWAQTVRAEALKGSAAVFGASPIADADGDDPVDFVKITSATATGGLWSCEECTGGGATISPAGRITRVAVIGPEPKVGLVLPVFYDHGLARFAAFGYVHKIFLTIVTDAGVPKFKFRTTSDGITWTDLLEAVDAEPCT